MGERHKFDPTDKQALMIWDTTENSEFFTYFFWGFRIFLYIISIATLIVGGIGVANIMYVVVEERTREIGIKMALGAKSGFVLRQFLFETLFLTFTGGVMGFMPLSEEAGRVLKGIKDGTCACTKDELQELEVLVVEAAQSVTSS